MSHKHKVNSRCLSFSSAYTIEGFGGKRALGSLLKSELCQKPSSETQGQLMGARGKATRPPETCSSRYLFCIQ